MTQLKSQTPLGERIKEIRMERGMSVPELCEKSECSTQVLYHLERGLSQDIRVKTLIPICNTLKVSPDYLVGLTDKKENLNERIYLLDIKSSIMKILKEKGFLDNDTLSSLAKKNPDIELNYIPRFHSTANIYSLVKFAKFLNVSLKELISCTASEKISRLKREIAIVENQEAQF